MVFAADGTRIAPDEFCIPKIGNVGRYVGYMMDVVEQIVLASGSPRRQQFLRELGLPHQIVVADIDETPLPGEAPVALAHRLAKAKAAAVASRLRAAEPSSKANKLIIAADTVVALGDELLGKPVDAHEATSMLRTLRSQTHDVHSSVCLWATADGRHVTRVNSTAAEMRDYSDAEIATYVATGDPLDKAGAYAIQHPDFAPVCALTGCISGVIGLPLADLRDLLAEMGVVVTADLVSICESHTSFACCQRC